MPQERRSAIQRRKALINLKRAGELRKKRSITPSPTKRRGLASKAETEKVKARRRNALADSYENQGE